MSRFDALPIMAFILAAALSIGYLAFESGEVIIAPPVKSDWQLCQDRGGVYVVLRSGPNRCFAKDAFK